MQVNCVASESPKRLKVHWRCAQRLGCWCDIPYKIIATTQEETDQVWQDSKGEPAWYSYHKEEEAAKKDRAVSNAVQSFWEDREPPETPVRAQSLLIKTIGQNMANLMRTLEAVNDNVRIIRE